MKREKLFFAAMIGLCTSAVVFGYMVSKRPVESYVQIDKAVMIADNDFGFRVFKGLAKHDADVNIFISPPSLALALSMTYNGANGGTKDAMAKAMAVSGMSLEKLNQVNAALIENLNAPGPGVEMAAANSLWASKDFELVPDFEQRTINYYHAEIASLDFSSPDAKDTINGWIRDNTQGKIDDVIKDTSNTILFLVNTVYFKGTWKYKFDISNTRDGQFKLLDGSLKLVPFMSRHGEFKYLRGSDFEAINLPYCEGRMSMYIFLPDHQSSLEAFLAKLNMSNWQKWMSQFCQSEGDIALPRFKADYRAEDELKAVLGQQGMAVAFTPQADFSRMARGIAWIDKVIHQTYLDVNEEGTEAAAATVVAMMKVAIKPGFSMLVDHPFFCAIRDNKTGVILFMGSIVEPN